MPRTDPHPDLVGPADAQGSLETLYNPTVVDHIAHPRNLGALDGATGVGTIDDAATENFIIIYARVERGVVVAASFRAIACSACIAASSITTELLVGRGVATLSVSGADVLHALGGLPREKEHCARLAAEAASLALAASI